MAYKITNRTKSKARAIGVKIKPSTRKNKKIDVFDKEGNKLCSIGDTRYKDYHIYRSLERNGKVEKGTAEKRKRAYKSRHGSYKKNSCGYFAEKLLWN